MRDRVRRAGAGYRGVPPAAGDRRWLHADRRGHDHRQHPVDLAEQPAGRTPARRRARRDRDARRARPVPARLELVWQAPALPAAPGRLALRGWSPAQARIADVRLAVRTTVAGADPARRRPSRAAAARARAAGRPGAGAEAEEPATGLQARAGLPLALSKDGVRFRL